MSLQIPDVSEDDFRAHSQERDRAQARMVLRFFLWVSLPLFYIDYRLLGFTAPFWSIASLRGVIWLYGGWLFLRFEKLEPGQSVQERLFLWAIIVLLVQLVSNTLAPNIYLGHFIIDAWLCLIIPVVLPLRLSSLKQLAIGFLLASIALALSKTFSYADQFTVIALLMLSTYSGQAISSKMYHYRRDLLATNLELQRKENTDPLTGVANRREFLRVSEVELQRHARLGKPLSLMVLDLDHLKQIKFSYGASAGDMVLVEVSKRVKRATRGYDCVARYGTEEFSVLLPEATEEVAVRIAARTQSTIVAMPVAASGKELKVTVSVGIATLREGDTLESMLRRAEDALLRSKMDVLDGTLGAIQIEPSQIDATLDGQITGP